MAWWSDITDFIGKNKDWLEPVVSTGVGLATYGNNEQSRSQYAQYLAEREQANYERALADAQNYNAQSQAGAAAAAATEGNRQAAAGRANDYTQAGYADLREMYQPFVRTAHNLLPKMSRAYQQGLNLQTGLSSFLNQPDQMAKLNGSVPAYNINVPLPDSVRLR